MIVNPKRHHAGVREVLVILFAVCLAAGGISAQVSSAQPAGTQAPSSGEAAPRIPAAQLDSLVAPIALYPDPLLAQTLAASTYPLEIIQLQQWLGRNAELKDKALADAAAKEPWDPSVQALAAVPDVVKRLADDIQWTTDLGNAFLAQQSDVMDAVQRMRKKAQDKNVLKSNEQQIVETRVIENKSVIVIEQASPDVIYVPSYSPVVVYGPPVYPYPPIYYPPAGALALSFGIGVAMGAWWGGGSGWNCGWGGGNVNINNNNNFIRNSNIRTGNRNQVGNAGNRWQHRPEHRGGAPYRDRATADRFGGSARGDSLANRQAGARQQLGRQGGNLSNGGAPRTGAGNFPGGAGGRSDRMGGGDMGNRAGQGARADNRVGGSGAMNRAGGGGADRVGNRDFSGRAGGGNRDAFGGGGRGYNGSSARASSNRGAYSARSGGGGGRGGGGRGGGGRRR